MLEFIEPGWMTCQGYTSGAPLQPEPYTYWPDGDDPGVGWIGTEDNPQIAQITKYEFDNRA